ncbi:TonB family protein [Caulobacter soli]|uniref:TonB family protein n=1 Tax=Caulobacter soli TaxID=2708539 RepID=UPI0013EC6B74|nr:TonB family protein [Caulobacter soli]
MSQLLRHRIGAVARIVIPVVVLAALAVGVWRLANDTGGVSRKVAPPPMVALAPPPPPPPPPPKEQPPEPVKDQTPSPTPDPQPEAPAKSDAPKQLTINGPAQAGADAFGVAAGKGGGVSVGGDPNGSDTGGDGGFAEASYQRYLRSQLQSAIQADDRVNRLFFAAQVRIWVKPDGSIGSVSIAKSSGDERADRALVAALQALPRLDPPPPQLKFPARVALRGRRA